MKLRTDDILTDREAQVVFGYVNGDNGKEIADKCCMSYRTVVNHTQNAFNKAECPHSIHALVSWWYRTNFPEVAHGIGKVVRCITIIFLILTISVEAALFSAPIRRPGRTSPRRRIEYRMPRVKTALIRR